MSRERKVSLGTFFALVVYYDAGVKKFLASKLASDFQSFAPDIIVFYIKYIREKEEKL